MRRSSFESKSRLISSSSHVTEAHLEFQGLTAQCRGYEAECAVVPPQIDRY